MLARMNSWNLNMTRCRVVTGVFRHPGKAVLAASTAALNSSAVVSGIRDTTSCVACDTPHTHPTNARVTHPPLTVPKSIRTTRNQKSVRRRGGLTGLVTSTCSSAPNSTNSPPMRRHTLGWGGRGGEKRDARSVQPAGRGSECNHAQSDRT